MATYYNEIDPQAAQWLRNLIAAGHLPEGDVDTRSIEDVHPHELRGYTQAHFFAGIGGWPLALRLAGWPDDRPVWTGSCPCQPFSAAGARAGFDDERHLWPAWYWLIEQCRPPVIFGEQVASKAADDWLDLVQADMEALDYALGAVPFPSASVGAPHIRDRLYWVANALGHRLQGWVSRRADQERETVDGSSGRGSATGGLGHSESERCGKTGKPSAGPAQRVADAGAMLGGMDDSGSVRRLARRVDNASNVGQQSDANGGVSQGQPPTGPLHGFWRDADWLACRDGKWRPVEPGAFPLAHGVPGRVVRLRAYGNAINVQQAAEFVRCTTDSN